MQPMKAKTIRRYGRALLVTAVAGLCPGLAHAQQAAQVTQGAVDSVPGSSRPVGVGMSPEAPPTPPAAGGRAPSFGAPVDPDAWALKIGGRFSASGRVGLGRTPKDQDVVLCDLMVAQNDGTPADIARKKQVAVAAFLSAAHTCE